MAFTITKSGVAHGVGLFAVLAAALADALQNPTNATVGVAATAAIPVITGALAAFNASKAAATVAAEAPVVAALAPIAVPMLTAVVEAAATKAR